MRALLAEADGSVRSHIHATLTQRGWRVTVTESGEAAIRAFESSRYPLVILGQRLPDMDGPDLCRAIRTTNTGLVAYLLVTLPIPTAAAMRSLVEAGADDFLSAAHLAAMLEPRLAFAECHLGAHPGADPENAHTTSYPERLAELEHALRIQQAALEELFQSAPEGIAVVDENDCVIRVSGEFSRMFGYDGAEVIGQPINDLIIPDHLRDEGEEIARAVVEGQRVTLETVRRARDGRLIDVSVLATPILVGGGSIGAYGIYRDISQRKAHERALAGSEARYRALFDQSPVGVFLCDLNLRVTQYNRRLAEITGQPAQPPGELKVAALIPGLRRVRVDRPAVYGGPMRVMGSGERRWVAVRFAPLQGQDGTVIGGIGVVEDVTERERAGQELRSRTAELARVNAQLRERTLELERAMKARNRLYSSMSHELRTPMSAILLYQELLLSGTLGELSEEQREALDHSHTAAQHLLELVSDVLDLSKIEAGKLEIHSGPVQLPRLLTELLATVDPLAQRFGSQLELVRRPGVPADRHRRAARPAGAAEPRLQRRQVRPRASRSRFGPRCGRRRSGSRWRTRASASTRRTSPRSSRTSSRWGACRAAAPASVWRSPAASPACSAGGWRWSRSPGSGAPSASPCPAPSRRATSWR